MKQQHKIPLQTNPNAYGTQHLLKSIKKSVLTKPEAYEAKTGFLRTQKVKLPFKQILMKILLITKSEFPPGVSLWRIQKFTIY